MMQNLQLSLAVNSPTYEINICCGLLFDHKALLHTLKPLAHRFALITHPTIASLYGNELTKLLNAQGMDTVQLTFPSGEENKNRETKEKIENQLFEQGFGADSCIIALGGGVVTDLSGFIAATYCRGIPHVLIPTSLLAMVDASIGGKTGVNVPYGKNMLGCIYQPRKILIDPTVLSSLPQSEVRNGVAEMIKHALIADKGYFDFLKQNPRQLLTIDFNATQTAIYGSCKIKKEIVEKDPHSKGIRNLLNLGHTVGHAIESVTHYSIPHGEAVAIGIMTECYLAHLMGILSMDTVEKIHQIFLDYALPFKLPSHISFDALFKAMTLDKKAIKNTPRFALIEEIGKPYSSQGDFCITVDLLHINKALHWMIHDLCSHQRAHV
ncbi:MAG: 3-dehydroquinate synthase [Parachlamydiales bacterium]|jgi:3-dehydroquinate synthase